MAAPISYTPAWLQRPNPGHAIFTSTPTPRMDSLSATSSSRRRVTKLGPRRTIAYRGGSEIFVAVGKEIRWADLVYLKDAWEDKQKGPSGAKGKATNASKSQYEEAHAQGYRTIKTQVADDIRQLIISPRGDYLAILTTHTVHISVLPESGQLTAADTSPMKLKTYTLGPTTHVTSQSGIASALWHPLGVDGACLVTVTEDAVVRVWELSTADRSSFDRPTLAIDLRKLADGTSIDQDFRASKSGMSKGFSPDSFDMEVASACFGSRSSGGWSSMTLWLAMREGDVYALCPLLPEKWSPPPTLIPSLSVSIVANIAAIEDDQDVPQTSKALAQQQLQWMSEIDSQEPTLSPTRPGEPQNEVFTRPHKPGKVPKLQGPFDLELSPAESEDELDSQLSDIFVIGAKVDAEELMLGEENELELDENDGGGLSVGVVCLLTSSGKLSILLDLDGVQAQWLPKTKSKVLRFFDEADPPSLLTFDILDTLKDGEVWEGNWPVFSPDAKSQYSFYITSTSSVTSVSIQNWASALEQEFNGSNESSTKGEFRINLWAQGKEKSERVRLYAQEPIDHSAPLSASILIQDTDLGYFLLTATPYGPISLSFETPEVQPDFRRSQTRSPAPDSDNERPPILFEPRPTYEPAHDLEEYSTLPEFLNRVRHGKDKRLLKEEVRLSPATLRIMTDAHRVLSEETHRIGSAAAELFRRCSQLQEDLQNQIKNANEVATRVDELAGEGFDYEGPVMVCNERIEQRIESAQAKQKELTERVDRIKRQISKGPSRELSDKEREWIDQVKDLESKILGEGEDYGIANNDIKEPWARYQEAQQLKEDLLEQTKEIKVEDEAPVEPALRVPSDIRKVKMAQVMSLLDRESALVEAARSRLEMLSVESL